jgi:hypothetical protein
VYNLILWGKNVLMNPQEVGKEGVDRAKRRIIEE